MFFKKHAASGRVPMYINMFTEILNIKNGEGENFLTFLDITFAEQVNQFRGSASGLSIGRNL